MERLSLSLVTPVYSGEEYLRETIREHEQFHELLNDPKIGIHHIESIFVCDEPRDGSATILEELTAGRSWMTVLALAKNSGQHSATAAGMLHTSGDWVVTLDEDGQHRLRNIPELLAATIGQGRDICYAHPTGSVHQEGWRNITSSSAKKLTARLVGDASVPLFSSFRLIRGDIARAAGTLSSHDLYLDVALGWFTERISSVKVDMRDPRGSQFPSGYSSRKLFSHFRKLVMSYQLKVMRFFVLGGFLTTVLSGVTGGGYFIARFIAPETIPVRGWTSLFLAILFFGGICTFLLGLILEYLSTLVARSQGRPAFFVVDRSRDSLWVKKEQDA